MELPTISEKCLMDFFQNLPEVTRDQEITPTFLEQQRSYTHRNATGLITTLKLFNFIGEDGVPKDLWWAYKVRPQETLRPVIKKVYVCLYRRYADPFSESSNAIIDALKTEARRSADWGERAARDFRAFCKIASIAQPMQSDGSTPLNSQEDVVSTGKVDVPMVEVKFLLPLPALGELQALIQKYS